MAISHAQNRLGWQVTWLLVPLLCLMPASASTQGKAERILPSSLPPPEKIVQILKSDANEVRQKLARNLALTVPQNGPREEAVFCTEFEQASVQYVVLEPPGPQAVLMAEGCEFYYLVVLSKEAGSNWQNIATVPLSTHYGQVPKISFATLVHPKEQEIIAQGVVSDWGTGFYQTCMIIFKLFGKRLETVFMEEEKVRFAIPTVRNGQPRNTDQSQESTFRFEDVAEGQGHGIKRIIERQVIRDNKTTIIRGRSFQWEPKFRRFAAFAVEP